MTGTNKFFSEQHQEEFKYLPYLFFYVMFVMLGVFLINKCLFDRKKFLSKGYDDEPLDSKTLPEICASYCVGMFCCCLRPCCGGKRPVLYPTVMFNSFCRTAGSFLLAITRVVSFLLILLIDIYMELQQQDGSVRTFSSWLNILACAFFLFIALLSCVGLFSKVCCSGDDEASWSLGYEKFSALCLVLYEVVGSNAAFVTLVSYCWLQRPQDTQSILVHLLVLVCFAVDMCFNKLPFRFEHYFYSLMLPVAYLLFQWGMVYDDRMVWQYSFLKSAKNDCFFKYSILFLIHLACYYCIAGIHYLRDSALGVQYADRHRVGEYDEEETDSGEGGIQVGGNAPTPRFAAVPMEGDGSVSDEGHIHVTIEDESAPQYYEEDGEHDDIPMAEVLTTSQYSPVSQI